MPSETVWMGVLLVLALVFALTLHEWAHAAVATLRGDTTAKDLGRLTLNPIPHIDPVLTVILPAMLWFVLPALLGTPPLIFGGAKPVPVQQENLRSPHRDMMLVAMAGPAMNAVLAFMAIALSLGLATADLMDPKGAAAELLARVAGFNVLLLGFNLLPIPPLDGSRIAAWLLPPLRGVFRALERVGLLLVMALVFLVPGAQEWLFEALGKIYGWMFDVVSAAFKLAGWTT